MTSNKHEFKMAAFEDGTYTVLRADPAKPRLLEVVATFHDGTDARDYVRFQNTTASERREEQPIIKQAPRAKPEQVSKAKSAQASLVTHKQAPKAEPKQAPTAKPAQALTARSKSAPQVKPKSAAAGISEGQMAVLTALRSMMDKKHRVETRAAELAKASSVPLGSLHSILTSLEKKQMIRTERQGSAKIRAIYEVLETSRKSTRFPNGMVDSKEALAPATSH